MTTSESIAAIGAALAKAQGTIEGATKDSKNPHFNNDYANLASIVDACREALSVNGISFLQSPSNDANLVSMRTRLVHASGEWIESDHLTVQARDAGPQAVGSCLTYLRRYQLAGMVGVAPVDDDDAEKAEGRGKAQTVADVKPEPVVKATMKVTAPKRPVATLEPLPPRPEPPPISDKDIPFALLLPLALALVGAFA